MAYVVHILKDGSRVKDISGIIVKIEDAEPVYNLMDSINRKIRGQRENSNKGNQ